MQKGDTRGSQVFPFLSVRFRPTCLGPGLPQFCGGPGSTFRGVFYVPVWREHVVLGPPEIDSVVCYFRNCFN